MSFSFRSLSFAVTLVAAFCVATGAKARAETEFCPASVGARHAFEAPNDGLLSFYMGAASERTISATIVAQGETNWYTFAVAGVKILPDLAHYKSDSALFDRTEYHSKPLYLQLPAGEKIVRWWVSDAQSTGDAVGWDEKGDVACLPQGAPMTIARGKTSASPAFAAVTRTNPLHDLAQLPGAGDSVVVAKRIEAPTGMTACATPFEPATVAVAISPAWPSGMTNSADITTKVEVAVNADGTLKDAWIYQPSGSTEADLAALRAAHLSKYHGGVALCQPAPGMYLFVATFRPH